MKKLLTNLLLLILLNSFISAVPTRAVSAKATRKISTQEPNRVRPLKNIHPLYILEFRFY